MQASPLLKRARPRRPACGLRLLADPASQPVARGRRARFALRIENRAPRAQDVELSVGAPLDGWRAGLRVQSLRIPAAGAVVLFLRVEPPPDARLGERQGLRVAAVGSSAPARAVAVEIEAVVDA